MVKGRTWVWVVCAVLLTSGVPAVRAAERGPSSEDLEIEKFLREADVVDSEELGTGITRPYRLTLEKDGKTMRAAFKDVDIQKTGMTRMPDGKSEINFSDRYMYERAAYLLDRHLGMNMVPVAVVRKWRGKNGAVVAWVENATPIHEIQEQDLSPPNPVEFEFDEAIMKLFDALIFNVDRNLSNQLVTMDDGGWQLHLIDHSRSFRRNKELPEVFAAKPASLPRELYAALQSLDQDTLAELLDGLVTKPQIKAMLQRRDRIVGKVAEDVDSYGERLVFQD